MEMTYSKGKLTICNCHKYDAVKQKYLEKNPLVLGIPYTSPSKNPLRCSYCNPSTGDVDLDKG